MQAHAVAAGLRGLNFKSESTWGPFTFTSSKLHFTKSRIVKIREKGTIIDLALNRGVIFSTIDKSSC